MRFQVPQFLEIEDKLFGPLTFKQFIYIAGSIGIAVVLFMFLPNFIAFLLSAPVVAFGVALAFYKMNDKPFISVVEAFIKFHTSGKLYLWQKEEKVPTAANREAKPIEQVYVPRLSQSKLKDLTWSLDIKENNNPVVEKEIDPRFP
jgi:hypothetical protein